MDEVNCDGWRWVVVRSVGFATGREESVVVSGVAAGASKINSSVFHPLPMKQAKSPAVEGWRAVEALVKCLKPHA